MDFEPPVLGRGGDLGTTLEGEARMRRRFRPPPLRRGFAARFLISPSLSRSRNAWRTVIRLTAEALGEIGHRAAATCRAEQNTVGDRRLEDRDQLPIQWTVIAREQTRRKILEAPRSRRRPPSRLGLVPRSCSLSTANSPICTPTVYAIRVMPSHQSPSRSWRFPAIRGHIIVS